jgi:hypothetical protein
MLVISVSIHLEALEALVAETINWQHASDSVCDCKRWILGLLFIQGSFFEPAREVTVTVVDFLLFFAARYLNISSINDDDVVTDINMLGKLWLVLAGEQGCDLGGNATKRRLAGVNNVPLAGYI